MSRLGVRELDKMFQIFCLEIFLCISLTSNSIVSRAIAAKGLFT